MPCFLPSLRNALIKVSGSWTVSETSFTPSMSCLRGLPQLSSDFFFVRSSSFKEGLNTRDFMVTKIGDLNFDEKIYWETPD